MVEHPPTILASEEKATTTTTANSPFQKTRQNNMLISLPAKHIAVDILEDISELL